MLLAVSCLLRRADGVAVIGAALQRKAAGQGHRSIAVALGRPSATVRGWQRAFGRERAGRVRAVQVALLVQLDPLTGPPPVRGGVFAHTVEVVGACGSAARCPLGWSG